MTRSLVVATHNSDKLAELRRIVGPELPTVDVLGLADVPGYDEPVETEATFAGNALLKARVAVAHAGLPALADDSGLCVDIMNGMPGVFSARWSGRARGSPRGYELLLEQLCDVPDGRRTAAFVACVALVLVDGSEHTAHGEVRGRIVGEPRGAGGFGYDPVFEPEGESRTAAELTSEEKDALSHRGRALRALLPTLVRVLS